MSKPYLSVFLPISRPEYIEDLIQMVVRNLGNLKEKIDVEVVAYIDTPEEIQLPKWIRTHRSSRGVPIKPSVTQRRERIVKMKNESRNLIGDSKFVICIEDDTIIPDDAFRKLLHIAETRKIGTAQGVQVGRWGIPIIGAWKVDNIYEPKEAVTLPYIETKAKAIEKIDAGGWYCYITPTNLYKRTTRHWSNEPYGPDVNYGLDLRRRGYQNYIDWSLVCGHHNGKRILWPDKENLQQGHWKKNKNWQRIRP